MTTSNPTPNPTPSPNPSSPAGEPPQPAYAAFIGIDWADQEHEVWLQPPEGARPERLSLKQSPAALQQWANTLRQRFGGRPIAVALELSRGPLVYGLMSYEFLVLYPVNPKSLARYREAFRPSGAKDDRSDAELLCQFVRLHHSTLTAWKPEDAATRALARFNEIRRDWVDQITALGLRLRADAKAYYPLFLELFGDQLDSPMACHFLQRWPTWAALQNVREPALRRFFYAEGSRSEERIQERLQFIRQAQPLTQDEGVVVPHQADALVIVELLLVLLKQVKALEAQIDKRFAAHPDAFIFESLPGAGAVLGPRLLAAFGTDRSRFPKPECLQQLSGIAPITVASGTMEVVHFRYAAPRFLHQTFWEFAKCSLPQCGWAQAVVDRLQQQGQGFNAAVRVVAFKWMRILWRLWQNREPYVEAKYLAALERKGSPYFKTVAVQPAGE